MTVRRIRKEEAIKAAMKVFYKLEIGKYAGHYAPYQKGKWWKVQAVRNFTKKNACPNMVFQIQRIK